MNETQQDKSKQKDRSWIYGSIAIAISIVLGTVSLRHTIQKERERDKSIERVLEEERRYPKLLKELDELVEKAPPTYTELYRKLCAIRDRYLLNLLIKEEEIEPSYVEYTKSQLEDYSEKEIELKYSQEVERIKKLVEQNPNDPKVVMDSLDTILEAIIFCTEILKYEENANIPLKFSEIYKAKKGDDCEHAVIAAAALLKEDIKPYVLVLEDRTKSRRILHTVLIYKDQHNMVGSIGVNYSDNVSPIYESIEELINEINTLEGANYEMLGIGKIEDLWPDFDK